MLKNVMISAIFRADSYPNLQNLGYISGIPRTPPLFSAAVFFAKQTKILGGFRHFMIFPLFCSSQQH